MTQAMITAAQPEAAEAGADILRAGGNIVDAAVAAALVQTAVDPQMCGIAGMGCMHLYLPSRGVHTTIDFHGRSPAAYRASFPAAAEQVPIPACIVRMYARPQHRTFREDSSAVAD